MDEKIENQLEPIPEEETEEGPETVRGSGTLYIVATPIGNSRDMSPRGRQILEEADMIAAEDTRRSMVLLGKLGVRNRLVSNHKFNEYGKARFFINEMKQGKSVAVITDAGTPCISDPGNELIRAAVEEGIRVVGVPGCCAAVNALAISGFDLSSFQFLGFFPRENAERLIREQAGVRLCLCNDMTKLHEMSFRGTPAQVKEQLLLKGNYEKGEYALALELEEDYRFRKTEHLVSPEAMLVDAMVRGLSPKEAVAAVLEDENNSYSKNELKAASLRLKKLFGDRA